MTLGEKIKEERKKLNMSQDDLARAMNVSRRSVTSWETDKSLPRTRKVYEKLAEVLQVPLNYLLQDDQAFILEAYEKYGTRGKKGAEKLATELGNMFTGGEIADEDMDTLMFGLQQAYLTAKARNKKYTPKKYLRDSDTDPDSPVS